ncbi:hypothetical protein FA95DRAFT_1613387 [Auriscalpium vulgare]|uniref:Uncharacterized protein n=1 Tax=Auriscalpium vulgare TaxID=40419 RepID=A0ACB8R3H8_9AGAM|nr:hypothetical protein FA95DRAFT_1613387 [Auriscalpium vulgare]
MPPIPTTPRRRRRMRAQGDSDDVAGRIMCPGCEGWFSQSGLSKHLRHTTDSICAGLRDKLPELVEPTLSETPQHALPPRRTPSPEAGSSNYHRDSPALSEVGDLDALDAYIADDYGLPDVQRLSSSPRAPSNELEEDPLGWADDDDLALAGLTRRGMHDACPDASSGPCRALVTIGRGVLQCQRQIHLATQTPHEDPVGYTTHIAREL